MARIKPQALLQQSKKKKTPSRFSLTTTAFSSLILFLVLFCVFSTFRYFSTRSVNQGEQGINLGRKGLGNLKNADVPKYAILETSKGDITVKLIKDNAPELVNEFIALCKKGHFKGMQFHRVIKKAVIQIGNSRSLESAADWTSRGKPFSDSENRTKHEVFMFGKSKREHETEGLELFITTLPLPDQNEQLDIFAKVVKGFEVVKEIQEVETDEHYQPMSRISVLDVMLQHSV